MGIAPPELQRLELVDTNPSLHSVPDPLEIPPLTDLVFFLPFPAGSSRQMAVDAILDALSDFPEDVPRFHGEVPPPLDEALGVNLLQIPPSHYLAGDTASSLIR